MKIYEDQLSSSSATPSSLRQDTASQPGASAQTERSIVRTYKQVGATGAQTSPWRRRDVIQPSSSYSQPRRRLPRRFSSSTTTRTTASISGHHKAPMSSNLAWHLQQPRATSWQSQPAASQVPWQYQQPHPVQPLYQQRPQAAPQAPSGQGFLGFVEQHKQFHGYASTASGNTSSSDDRSAGDASRNDSMDSTHSGSWGLLRDVGQFGSLDSEMAYASVGSFLPMAIRTGSSTRATARRAPCDVTGMSTSGRRDNRRRCRGRGRAFREWDEELMRGAEQEPCECNSVMRQSERGGVPA